VRVIVTVDQTAKKYLTDTAQFWVVTPAISLEGVSGLETLLSGAFLEIDPGKGGEEQLMFEGLETPPVITSKVPGREFMLRSNRLGNIKRGSPLLYKGLQVGRVLGHRLSKDKQTVEIITFVEEPYSELVTEYSKFWDAGSVNVKVSPSGIEAGANSLATLLSGAIEFSSPSHSNHKSVVVSGREFLLYTGKRAMEEARFTERVPYVLYFEGSVSGLEVGAPVEFNGIKIGSVRDITLEINEGSGEYFIPILINIETQRLKVREKGSGEVMQGEDENLQQRALNALIKSGLRARLKSSNFLTGQLIVDLDLFPGKPARYVGLNKDLPELPTLPTELEEITTSLTRLVEKIERLPIEKLSNSMIRTAEGVEKIVTNGRLVETITEYRELAKNVNKVVTQVNRETLPRITETVEEGRTALKRVGKTLGDASSLFTTAQETLADGSPLKYDLSIMLRELASASRSVRNLAEFLERNPSALLSGKK
jgi:paraquat-inducible protein B